MPEWGLTEATRKTTPWGLSEWWLQPGKVITDPIHGDVFLTRLEQFVADTPPLQRLRRVRQLGTTHLVYPGATHTRFSHSLGAVRVAQTLLDVAIGQRNRNHPLPDLFEEWVADAESEARAAQSANGGSGNDDGTTEVASRDPEGWEFRYRKRLAEATVLARLGALLHDIGHVAFGHTIEDDLKLLTPHDENIARFDALWEQILSSIEQRLAVMSHSHGEKASWVGDRMKALKQFEIGGRLYKNLRPLVLSKEKDENGKTIEAVDQLDDDYPFVADIVGNTICADLLDYLPRDHRFTGLPMSLGDRYLSSFYVTRSDIGGIYERRMALKITRDGRRRQDVVTEILKHLRYRYELQERVLVHRAKLAVDAMVGKMLELRHASVTKEIRGLSPAERGRKARAIPDDFVTPKTQDAEEAGANASTRSVERIVGWDLEQLFLRSGDDGLLEKLADEGRADDEGRASQALADAILNRHLYRHAADGVTNARDDMYKTYGPADKRRELELAAAGHAGLAEPWHVVLWVPGPKMRLKLAELLVDHGTGIAKFKDLSSQGSDIYEAHEKLWAISVFVHPTVTEKQTRAVLAELARQTGITWDAVHHELGGSPQDWPYKLAAMEVLQVRRIDHKVRQLVGYAKEGEQLAARAGGAENQDVLEARLRVLAEDRKLLPRRRGKKSSG